MTKRSDDRDSEFSRFYAASIARLVGRCVLIGAPEEDARGIVQELMIEIYRRWPEIRSPEAYAKRALAFRTADFLKISARTVARDQEDLTRLGLALSNGIPDDIRLVEERPLILEALSQLPPVQRAVFALTYDGFAPTDIAAILSMKKSTVRSNLRHAQEALRAWWEQKGSSTEGGREP
jgi:RNA polymerase sigma factor (sigma-70 family)